MAVKTRQETREALGALLTTEMTGAGNPVQAAYDYLPGSFDGKSPVIGIASSGTYANPDVEQFGDGGWFPTYWYEIDAFVVREDEQEAEDELDAVAQKLFQVLNANCYYAGYWEKVAYSDRSTIEPVVVGGDPYWMETTFVRIEVFG